MKTLQQAAREYVKELAQFSAEDESTLRMAESIFLAGAAFTTRWIRVEDELPEPGEPYDEKYYSVKCPLFSESGYAFAEFGRDGCWVEDSTGRDITQYVTHWRCIEYKE